MGWSRIKKNTKIGRGIAGVMKWNQTRAKSGGFTALVKGSSKQKKQVSKAHFDKGGRISHYTKEEMWLPKSKLSYRQRMGGKAQKVGGKVRGRVSSKLKANYAGYQARERANVNARIRRERVRAVDRKYGGRHKIKPRLRTTAYSNSARAENYYRWSASQRKRGLL